MIHGVTFKKLEVYDDDRGYLFEILSVNDPGWQPVPHVYLATAYRGVAKAFHAHLYQTDRFCVVWGRAKIGMVDLRGPVSTLDEDLDRWIYQGKRFRQVWGSDQAFLESLGLREASPSFGEHQTVILDGSRPALLRIPAGVAHGQMALSEISLLLNMPTREYNRAAPDELRIPSHSFGYSWPVEDR